MRQDAQYNHQKILTTATHLLSTQDIATMKMTDIAHAARIGVGTLYRNYPNKSALCLALVYDRLRVFITTTQAQIKQTTPTSATLKAVLTDYLAFRDANQALLNTISEVPQAGQDFYQSPLFQQLTDLFQKLLTPLHPDWSAQTIVFRSDMLVAMLKSEMYAFERQQRGLSNPDLLHELLSLLEVSPAD
ncbi:TetR/AcrR family transcriptional regulator [Levilactobacillus brevis]|uniref:TetR/AcrR family transcriptional regulator n=1 Tax=Levilactobacillus brevis TaxID=1580 RepID=UPI000572F4AF|nr:TetR/AcrR family transcriptional regulator [Levilactobacillus brevis]AJA80654.1 hypothetical protein L747_01395 [Levilactobacillus brevis BSO 464]